MSSAHEQPNQSGTSKPQVVVRAGKYFVCSACGTMVEIPAEVVGQLVIAVEPSDPPPEEVSVESSPKQEKPAQRECPSRAAEQPSRPSSQRRPKQPGRAQFAGKIIDGLKVPSAEELDRAFAWVSFHLKVLDRQGSEIKRLKKLLKARSSSQVPPQRPRRHANKHTPQKPADAGRQAKPDQDQAILPVESPQQAGPINERGPP